MIGRSMKSKGHAALSATDVTFPSATTSVKDMDLGGFSRRLLAGGLVAVPIGILSATLEAGELHEAASRGDLAAINALLRLDSVDLDAADVLGTPLHRAIMGRQYRAARRLVAAGASLDVVDATLGTPLYLAVHEQDEAAARLLIDWGADLETQGPIGTPLHVAAQHDTANLVDLLLDNGANVDARNRETATPLHLAARRGGLDSAAALLAKGADIEARNAFGQTPIFSAAVGPNAVNLVPFLIEHGAGINVRDGNGMTALTLAINQNRRPAIEFLRTHGGVE